MEGQEGNQKHVQNEAGQSGTKNSSEEAPTEDVGEFTALINYVIRRNDEVFPPPPPPQYASNGQSKIERQS